MRMKRSGQGELRRSGGAAVVDVDFETIQSNLFGFDLPLGLVFLDRLFNRRRG